MRHHFDVQDGAELYLSNVHLTDGVSSGCGGAVRGVVARGCLANYIQS